MYLNGISVIVCCYNSASRLPETLKHLALQNMPTNILWELVVINNASTDNTSNVAFTEWSKLDCSRVKLTIIDEPRLGLSHARARGIEHATYEYVVFCDDDNWLDQNYLYKAYTILNGDETIAALGGQSTATSTINFPTWFESSKTNYAVGKQAIGSGEITYRKHLWGSGIVIRKSLFKTAFHGFASVLHGRKKNELASGEDSEMCMRFILMGYRLYYSEDLMFIHYIPKERLTVDYNKRLMDGFIVAHEMLNIYSRLIDMRSLSAKEKLILTSKSIIKTIFAQLFNVSRWNVKLEGLNIYLHTNKKFKFIDEKVIQIKEFSNKARY